MSVVKNFRPDELPFEMLQEEAVCFECGSPVAGVAVTYDGYAKGGLIKSIVLHPACAAIVGQRLICDGYPNRREKNQAT
ncbi:hypothetical protein P3W55_04830 [Pseudomonas citronellolis]|uniref:Uncharacterized protein n=1 Tax=Pseudomonas citronellolis TaxID=53408 RepID=A0AAW6P2S9_9PSED|nr:hypothetical protein [Pseudomonas citronellolis]MDF3841030.1 hypothetical protein [Pseudomonas citronellolis]